MITKIILGVLCILMVALVVWAASNCDNDEFAKWLGDDE